MSVISQSTRILLRLSMLKGVGPAALKKAASIPEFNSLSINEFAKFIPQIDRSLSDSDSWEKASEAAHQQEHNAAQHQTRILSVMDMEYPLLLSKTRDDPCIIYVKGTLAQIPEKSVAVIGTREPTIHGMRIAARITEFLVEHGWSIVSGLAIGCDAVAHKSAVSAGGHTVAVLAHGLQMIAPAKHKALAEDILAAGGALISEYPFGQNVRGPQYVKRDRTQAGLAAGVVMIQSDVKGGSLYASRASLDYGRWLAVPYPTDKDHERAEPKVKANLLIAEGADSEKADLLRCSLDKLQKIIVLRSRDDYFRMLRSSENIISKSSESYFGNKSLFQEFNEETASAVINKIDFNNGDNELVFSEEERSEEDIFESSVSVESKLLRRVVIDKYAFCDPKIINLEVVDSLVFRLKADFGHSLGSLELFPSRLKYIERRLKKLAVGKLKNYEQFIVEDLIAQIKNAIDDIMDLHAFKKKNKLNLNDCCDNVFGSKCRPEGDIETEVEMNFKDFLDGLLSKRFEITVFGGLEDDSTWESRVDDVYLSVLVGRVGEIIKRIFI